MRVCEDRAPATLDTLWEAMGTRPCGFAAQMLPGRYLLTYTATDKYGAKGVLVRTLLVLQRCPDGEVKRGRVGRVGHCWWCGAKAAGSSSRFERPPSKPCALAPCATCHVHLSMDRQARVRRAAQV